MEGEGNAGEFMSRIKDMTEGNPTKLIVTFALPLMLGNLGQQLYTVVDAIIVGQGVGVSALASLGATDWAYWFFLWFMSSMAQGFSILIAQRFGARDYVGLRKAVTMSALIAVVTGALVTVIGMLAAAPVLRLLNTPADIFDGALLYLNTLFAGSVVVMAYNVASSVLRALGDGKSPLAAMVIAAFINIALDLLFVMVFGWGIFGAALATLLAQLFSLAYCLYVIRHVDILRMRREDWRTDRQTIGRLLRLGLPLAIQHNIIAVGGMVVQFVLNGFGFLFVAGFTATNKLYGMLESTAISFGYSMTTYMGQNLGAGKMKRIDAGMRAVLRLSVAVSVTISAVMIALGRPLLGLFVPAEDPNTPQVLEIAYQYLFIMAVCLFILYMLHAYRSSLQGLGNTTAPLISGVLEFFMRVGVALVLPPLVGEMGIFFAEPAAWLGADVVLIFSYYREARRVRRQLAGSEAALDA